MGTIKTIKQREYIYKFTCPHCNTHSCVDSCTNVYQKDGLTDRKMRFCRNCKKAIDWVKYEVSDPEGWTRCD